MNDLSNIRLETEKLTKKRHLISRFNGNERKFVIKKRHRVKYEKKIGNALSANFRFERQRAVSGILMN